MSVVVYEEREINVEIFFIKLDLPYFAPILIGVNNFEKRKKEKRTQQDFTNTHTVPNI
jgi:hypothetical protein